MEKIRETVSNLRACVNMECKKCSNKDARYSCAKELKAEAATIIETLAANQGLTEKERPEG